MDIKICDCTLRDGGYYTNWDFDRELVKMYLQALNDIPVITHIEIGYRSNSIDEYLGEYFYCPQHVMEMAKELCPNKTLAIMLNEKDTQIDLLDELLNPCMPYIDLIRIAVDPKNIERASELSKAIKSKNFQIGFNIMYMSEWATDEKFIKQLHRLEGNVDYIYLVDSFGGAYPDDVKKALKTVKSNLKIPIGFHGHNNMELGLANSLTAIENGCEIIDVTITGMGRGAGNLKTELLLTSLSAQGKIYVDFNKLNPIVSEFEKMQRIYAWGTNLPYMISGAYSLPQKDVMSWISKRRYTTESIINALQNRKNNRLDNYSVPILENEQSANNVIIIGGGPNAHKHAHALKQYCEKYPKTVLIHAGTRYVEIFNDIRCRQYFCLLGVEGNKLQKSLPKLDFEHIKCVLEPSPRKMGTILPSLIQDKTFELKTIDFLTDYPDSLLTIAFQLAKDLNAEKIMLFGLDGYDLKQDEQMIEVAEENQKLINSFKVIHNSIYSLMPTKYNGIKTSSIYSKL